MMRQALELGAVADKEGDMGVGAVIVRDGKVVGRGRNRIHTGDPLVHAETDAIADACRALGTDDLSGSTLYTTMEPCPMCAGALLNVKVGHWVLGGRFKAVGRSFGKYSVETFASGSASSLKFRPSFAQKSLCDCAVSTLTPRMTTPASLYFERSR